MGSKPKASEYKASEVEKIQARQAQADQRYFQQMYDPLLREERDRVRTEDTQGLLRGRAQADTMEALTNPEMNRQLGGAPGGNIFQAGSLASSAVGQMLHANVLAKDVKITDSVNVLKTARNQQRTAGDALAQASRITRSGELADKRSQMQVRLARRQMGFDLAVAAGKKMAKNYEDTDNPLVALGGYEDLQDAGVSGVAAGAVGRKRVGLFGKNRGYQDEAGNRWDSTGRRIGG